MDYNGDGKWTQEAILKRYLAVCAELGTTAQVFGAIEYARGNNFGVFAVMRHIIDAVAFGDRASIVIAVEFIEEDRRFPFGRILKSAAARPSGVPNCRSRNVPASAVACLRCCGRVGGS